MAGVGDKTGVDTLLCRDSSFFLFIFKFCLRGLCVRGNSETEKASSETESACVQLCGDLNTAAPAYGLVRA